jgi:hypothetical protein
VTVVDAVVVTTTRRQQRLVMEKENENVQHIQPAGIFQCKVFSQ